MPHHARARTAPVAWLAVPATAVLAAAAWLAVSASTRATEPPPARATVPPSATAAVALSMPPSSPPRKPAAKGIVLSARSRAKCAPAASACADLSAHLTWLQAGGHITYGPVRMEPGASDDPPPRHVPCRLEGRAPLHQHQLRGAHPVRGVLRP